MGLGFDELKELEAHYSKKSELGPYTRLNLKNISKDSLAETDLENYKSELKKIYGELFEHFNGEADKPNKRIAIIGVTGVGKTRIAADIYNKLTTSGDELTISEKSNFFIFTGGKVNRIEFGGNMPFKANNFKNGVFFFDDAHLLYYPPLSKNKNEPRKGNDELQSVLKNFTQTVIISTWNIFGLNYALSKDPELLNNFDKVLWVEGLDNNNLESMLKKRLKAFSLNKEKFDFEKTFDKNGIKLIIEKSANNPRLLIHLLDLAINDAHDKKKDTVDLEIFEKVVGKRKINFDVNQLMNDQVVFNALCVPRVSLKMLEAFTGLDRTTLIRKIQALKGIIDEVGSDKKEKYYSLNCFLRVELEKKLFADIKERANHFIDINKKLM